MLGAGIHFDRDGAAIGVDSKCPTEPAMNTAVDFSPNVLPRPMPEAMRSALRARCFAARLIARAAAWLPTVDAASRKTNRQSHHA